jgi:hypothetical protein
MLSLTCPPIYLPSSIPPERAAGNKILGLESLEILDGLLVLMLLFSLFLICLGFRVYCNDRFQRGVKRKPMTSIKKLRKAVR